MSSQIRTGARVAPYPMCQEEGLFEQALALSPEARLGFLLNACGEDTELRERLERLLSTADDANRLGFLPTEPASGRPSMVEPDSQFEQAGSVIDRYKLLQPIGEGGMGVVYMAEQRQPVVRRVALKIIKVGMDTRHVVARFEAERQALAMMDHPNIARVLDGGATAAGRPYFVMELVEGVPITEFCDENGLSTRERLDLFMQVCQAVQSAHQKGIIHRDIKPSNVLVTLHNGEPMPKVIDFGIAKATNQRLTEKTYFTTHGAIIGTPAYMSPEQAQMSNSDEDTRADVYSLGVLLYQLLTGSTPFPEKRLLSLAYGEMCRVISEEEPEPPSVRLSTLGHEQKSTVARQRREVPAQLRHLLRGELDWIIMKCLEKDRNRRYESAIGLAEDLRRHLNNEIVSARPPSVPYRCQKFIRRNKVMVTAASLVLVAVIAGSVVSLGQMLRARQELRRAVAAEAQARREQQNATAALHFIQDEVLSQAHPDFQPDPNLTVRSLVDRIAHRLDTSAQRPPMVEATIRQTIGSIYTELGEYPKAVHNYQIALNHQRHQLGETHLETLRSLYGLAMNRWWSGDMVQAEQLTREGYAASARAHGERHPLTVQFMQARALVLAFHQAMPWSDLERFFVSTLELHRDLFGMDDPRTLRVIYGFGLSCTLHEAELRVIQPLVAQAVEDAARTLGADHPQTGGLLAILSQLHYIRREFAEAERCAQRCVEIRQARLGESHPLTANAMLGLARMHAEQGEFASALRLTDRIQEMAQDGAVDTFPLWAAQIAGVGIAFLRQGDLAQAEIFCTQAYDAVRLKPDAFPVGNSLIIATLGKIRLIQEQYPEAEKLLREALDLAVKYAPHQTTRWITANHLGFSLARQGKFAEAEPLLLTSCQNLVQRRDTMWPILNPIHCVAQAHERLIDLYQNWGKPDQATSWRQRNEVFQQSEKASLPDSARIPM